MHAHLRHTAGGEQARTYHPVGVRAQVLLRGVLTGEAHDEHLAEYRRLRTEHRSTHSGGHLLAYCGEFLAHYLTCKVDVGAPVELHPHYGEAVGRLRAHAAHTGAAVDGGLYRERHKLLHFLGRHTAGFGHDDHGGGVEVGEHVHIGLTGGVQSAYDEQHRRHQHEYSVLKREAYYLVQHSSFFY